MLGVLGVEKLQLLDKSRSYTPVSIRELYHSVRKYWLERSSRLTDAIALLRGEFVLSSKIEEMDSAEEMRE
jgi:hypothetical protein